MEFILHIYIHLQFIFLIPFKSAYVFFKLKSVHNSRYYIGYEFTISTEIINNIHSTILLPSAHLLLRYLLFAYLINSLQSLNIDIWSNQRARNIYACYFRRQSQYYCGILSLHYNSENDATRQINLMRSWRYINSSPEPNISLLA